MARTVISITDWDNVNWDEIDFENFDRENLTGASLSQVSEFGQRQAAQKQETAQDEIAAHAETHFRKALIAGRDPRSDRLFGKYKASYDKLIFQHIPVHQIWDLTGIEEWSEEDWQECQMDFIWFRPFFVDKNHPNWSIISSHESAFREFMGVPDRYIRSIEDWNQVMWLFVDFEHFDDASLDPAIVPDHFIQEYQFEASLYRMIYRDQEASRRKWDEVDFTQWDWSGPPPDIHGFDNRNDKRARAAQDAWSQEQRKLEAERQRIEEAKQFAPRQIIQAGITLPDEA